MTSEGFFPFGYDTDILLSSPELCTEECDTSKEVFRRFGHREGQYFACRQISVDNYIVNFSWIVPRVVASSCQVTSRCLQSNKLCFAEIARLLSFCL